MWENGHPSIELPSSGRTQEAPESQGAPLAHLGTRGFVARVCTFKTCVHPGPYCLYEINRLFLFFHILLSVVYFDSMIPFFDRTSHENILRSAPLHLGATHNAQCVFTSGSRWLFYAESVSTRTGSQVTFVHLSNLGCSPATEFLWWNVTWHSRFRFPKYLEAQELPLQGSPAKINVKGNTEEIIRIKSLILVTNLITISVGWN